MTPIPAPLPPVLMQARLEIVRVLVIELYGRMHRSFLEIGSGPRYAHQQRGPTRCVRCATAPCDTLTHDSQVMVIAQQVGKSMKLAGKLSQSLRLHGLQQFELVIEVLGPLAQSMQTRDCGLGSYPAQALLSFSVDAPQPLTEP